MTAKLTKIKTGWVSRGAPTHGNAKVQGLAISETLSRIMDGARATVGAQISVLSITTTITWRSFGTMAPPETGMDTITKPPNMSRRATSNP